MVLFLDLIVKLPVVLRNFHLGVRKKKRRDRSRKYERSVQEHNSCTIETPRHLPECICIYTVNVLAFRTFYCKFGNTRFTVSTLSTVFRLLPLVSEGGPARWQTKQSPEHSPPHSPDHPVWTTLLVKRRRTLHLPLSLNTAQSRCSKLKPHNVKDRQC